jgi:Acetyltransferases, including N-acetylases of ribosomal proteins
MNQAPDLTGQRLLLRKPQQKDIADRISYGRTYEFVRMCGGDTRNLTPFTEEDGQRWFEFVSSNQYEWIIEYDGRCIGSARLTVNEQDRRGRYAIGIFDISRLGMGFGTEATNLVLDYAFNILKLHRVDLKVLEYNKWAIACYKKCGFVQEGIEREGALIEGKWETDVLMSILENEFHNNVK